MNNRKMIWLLLMVIISCICLNSSSLFASENEEAIEAVLQQFQKAHNAKDAKAAVSVFHPNARIKTGGSSGSFVTRQEYEKRLPERMEILGPLTYEDIQIEFKDNKATIEAIILFTQSGRRINIRYIMILEQGKWLITDQDY